MNPKTNHIFVANNWSNTIYMIDGGNNSVIATIPVGDGPYFIFSDSLTNLVYVTCHGDGTVLTEKMCVVR